VQQGDRFLDIGCGWGALVRHAARCFGAHAEGCTLSDRQFDYATGRLKAEGLAEQATIREMDYRDVGGKESRRRVRSLGLFFWGDAWTLGAWCELRGDFRNFRLDRISSCAVLDERFPDESGKRLADYLRAVSCDDSLSA
jgi:hypothetical protein